MRMSKYELVTEVSMLCDELEAARREADELRAAAESGVGEGVGLGMTDCAMLEAGREAVFAESTNCPWVEVRAERDVKTGEVRFTPFEDFRERALYELPGFMSKDEFFAYFAGRLRREYEEARVRAMGKLADGGDAL